MVASSFKETIQYYSSYNIFNRLAMTAVKALSPNVKATVLRHSLWSDAEEHILATIPSVSHPDNLYQVISIRFAYL